ncbi:MAG: inositol monophosphatase [Coprobacillus sp.]|nr:inositol monophosphatase [Coprobacillus sp.]
MAKEYHKEVRFMIKTLQGAFSHCFKKPERTRTDKSAFDFFTPVDIACEKYVLEALKKKYPHDNILSEETHSHTDLVSRTWTLDPIDGTFNMANNAPLFGMQMSLLENREIVASVIYLPKLHELYWAIKGEGAHRGKETLHVNNDVNVSEAGFNFGDYVFDNQEWYEKESKVIGYLSNKIKRIRMLGAASIDFAFTSCGRTSGYMIFTDNYWDICPGILLVMEAGGHIYSLDGEYQLGDQCIIATVSDEIYKLILEALK